MIQNARHKGLGVIIHIVMNSGYIKPMSSQSRLYVMPFTEQLQRHGGTILLPRLYLFVQIHSKTYCRDKRKTRDERGGGCVCVGGGDG